MSRQMRKNLAAIHDLACEALAFGMADKLATLAVYRHALEQIAALCRGDGTCQDVQGEDPEGTLEACAQAHESTRASVAWLLQAEEQRQRACYLHLDREQATGRAQGLKGSAVFGTNTDANTA